MENLKFYCNLNDLNEEEKKYNKISYKRLIDRISNNIFLFNEAPKVSNCDFEFICGNDYDEETDEYIEIFQYYLINLSYYSIPSNEEDFKNLDDNLIIAWSETLQNYVLMVPHLGTSWDYVLTDLEPTEDLKKAIL